MLGCEALELDSWSVEKCGILFGVKNVLEAASKIGRESRRRAGREPLVHAQQLFAPLRQMGFETFQFSMICLFCIANLVTRGFIFIFTNRL
jgi:hypothetical protein